MFDIGLMEIMVVLIIALLVIGPERMPEVARKLGAFMGKTKRFIHSMKEDSEISATVKDIQASMNLEEERKHLEELHQDINNDVSQSTENLNPDDFHRPFGNPAETSGNQFNKAPSQPNVSKAIEESSPIKDSEPASLPAVESQSTAKETVATATPSTEAVPTPDESLEQQNKPA